ncbi:metalloregulator ArsR/SmtB family transcription factor [Cytobacillus oceanisediminis]|uniref:ArsR/SmtB family transcription factor n=1 Tax=Cytobacillus oceanisediminis TaxID=665099 RepID=UPI0023DC1BB3|nr:metalloregulator ArsR/SmtB family transcription factor [Cytobacillus oceanisediminis]MDF2038424.1 metalloregulator ArsR/SmtB family transcription factor [Cytobacillus oceanisediminis]
MATADNTNFENVLIALADPTRRELLDLIALRGQATATALATAVTVSRQAVVKHLTILKDAKLVSSNRVGREVRYKVCPQQLSSTAEWMENLAADWDRKLDWIKRMAED